MYDRQQKAILFTFVAAPFAAVTAVFAANKSISHIFIVLPLVIMGILLFVAGYYGGKSRSQKK